VLQERRRVPVLAHRTRRHGRRLLHHGRLPVPSDRGAGGTEYQVPGAGGPSAGHRRDMAAGSAAVRPPTSSTVSDDDGHGGDDGGGNGCGVGGADRSGAARVPERSPSRRPGSRMGRKR